MFLDTGKLASFSQAPFTEWEDAVIKLAHEEFGTKWALISRWLHNRTDNSVKNRFTCKLSSSEKVQSLGNRYLRAGMSLEKLLKTVDPDAPRHMSNGLASPVVPSSSGITSPQKTPRSGSGHNATSSLEEDVKVKGVGKKRAEKQAIQDAPEETFVRLRDAMTTNPRSSQQMNDPANQVRAGLAERTADLSRFGMQGSYHQDLSGRHASSSYAGREEDEEEAAAKMQYLQRGTKPPWGPLMDGRHLGRHYAPQQYDRSYWYSSHGVPPPYKMPWP